MVSLIFLNESFVWFTGLLTKTFCGTLKYLIGIIADVILALKHRLAGDYIRCASLFQLVCYIIVSFSVLDFHLH